MRAHAESIGNGLKVFLFFMDAVTGAPPPCLVDKRAVRRIHEPDDAMVHTDGHFGGQIGQFEPVAECWNARRWKRRLCSFGETNACRFRLRNEHPDVAILFLAAIAACVNAVYS